METPDAGSAALHEDAAPESPPSSPPRLHEFSELQRQLAQLEARLELLAEIRIWSAAEIQQMAICNLGLAQELGALVELTRRGHEQLAALLLRSHRDRLGES